MKICGQSCNEPAAASINGLHSYLTQIPLDFGSGKYPGLSGVNRLFQKQNRKFG
jgi:hypothetical protein